MESKDNKCFKCREFQRYYIKRSKDFKKTKYGRCCKNDETVTVCQSCDKWKANPSFSQSYMKTRTKTELNDILRSLTAIRQIIEENESETDL